MVKLVLISNEGVRDKLGFGVLDLEELEGVPLRLLGRERLSGAGEEDICCGVEEELEEEDEVRESELDFEALVTEALRACEALREAALLVLFNIYLTKHTHTQINK